LDIIYTLVEADTDSAMLKKLDTLKDEQQMFPVLVSPSMIGMRGYNYRAPTTGITLVVA
jgi:hypothetical protein